MAPVLVAAGIAVAVPACVLLWLNRTRVAVEVVGHSMEPTFRHGDRLLVRRVPAARLRVGDVVVLGQPDTDALPDLLLLMGTVPPWVVKRVAALPGDRVPDAVPGGSAGEDGSGRTVPPGRLVVLGDNTGHSTDSRVWGPVPDDRVLGTVLRRMSVSRAAPAAPAAADDGQGRGAGPAGHPGAGS
ncbi:S26 family signal peptidase [Nocardiopsis sp. NRRL B-16309]|uniref:S26 family signal peptidase n=1 Tax=Nocardiopsis sp. NRRL B-16309 TaxID=1519494 RepID=UPI0006AF35F5|nr:S26 family signal peptidase [Nocardiopsis sp. NRRL B-16309]